ncbi:DoxX family protein [Ciceribacter sp. L1K23]|uniref:DoxX family protein n=1 Tax=unclassified Ciceribacter TaxID=2628820 RepID=UPI001ABE0604|nr:MULTISPECIES: DoxX family protein [unclassified Ciceribacter]MBO3758628.1 DoxX family protein [Ciceribacter sp. L1K22]MBR0557419.1 DoxX family protein [Ciceribacter sp. L1K23]
MTLPLDRNRLVIPRLAPLYAGGHDAVETVLRVVAGVLLVVHGYGKILDPFGAVGMVEGLGFYPGVLWSPLLAGTEFFGGILLAIGLLTRPAAVAATIVLLVTVYFHWVAMDQGLSGAEKSILWAAITLYFAFRGGNRHSVDARLARTF